MSTELTKSTIAIAGENALIVYFGDKPSPEISRHLANTTQILEGLLAESLVDLVPSYASLLVIYNPLKIDHHGAQKAIRNALKASANSNMAESPTVQKWSRYRSTTPPKAAQTYSASLTTASSRSMTLLPSINKLNIASTPLASPPDSPTSAKSTRALPCRDCQRREQKYPAEQSPLPTARPPSTLPNRPAVGI